MLLRLRERYLALQKDHREVTRLMVDSLSTFSTLFRHALILTRESLSGGRSLAQAQAAAPRSFCRPRKSRTPTTPLRWTCKSVRKLAEELNRLGHQTSHRMVAELLHELGYSLAYRVLHGEDVVAISSIEVEPVHHRYQVEHELRSMLLRLRGGSNGSRVRLWKVELQRLADETGLELRGPAERPPRGDPPHGRLALDLLDLERDAFRHALILSGAEPPVKKREVFREAASRFNTSSSPFETLLDIREGARKLPNGEIRPLFEDYLAQITRTAEHVDRI